MDKWLDRMNSLLVIMSPRGGNIITKLQICLQPQKFHKDPEIYEETTQFGLNILDTKYMYAVDQIRSAQQAQIPLI